MDTLSTIRDLIYQSKYSESFRLAQKHSNKYISIEYIKTHGAQLRPKIRSQADLSHIRDLIDDESTPPGYGDGFGYHYTITGTGNAWGDRHSRGDNISRYYRGTGFSFRSHIDIEHGNGWAHGYGQRSTQSKKYLWSTT